GIGGRRRVGLSGLAAVLKVTEGRPNFRKGQRVAGAVGEIGHFRAAVDDESAVAAHAVLGIENEPGAEIGAVTGWIVIAVGFVVAFHGAKIHGDARLRD